MLPNLAKKFFGSANQRYVKKLQKDVDMINALEPKLQALSDSKLQAKTDEFRGRLAGGEELNDILHEAFATVREASKRTLGLRPFDVQLVGGIILHRGMVAEMKTGEGKTLVATMPVYLNALFGKGVHVVTVNDYLAKRDAQWMGKIYEFLGLKVGIIQHNMIDEERREAYTADITYGTNNEFGFDYLRDNMKFELEAMVQRPFYYAIVDEVDSILIDEARTPLIISGPTEDSSELYIKVDKVIPRLIPEDYEIDEKSRSVTLTDKGNEHAEQELQALSLLHDGNLYDVENISLLHHVNQALRAHVLFERDKDYIVKDNQVIIIDEFTGRMMEGRRYSDGLHQAIEAKENAKVELENQTLASITFQNYFRLYPKLAGMTGTAMTEAHELQEIYKLEVVEIPTNVPCIRRDEHDEIYSTTAEKHQAILEELKQALARGQPILVGTTSIEKSEQLSTLFKKQGIKHNVLNARYHEQEAYIIAQAGKPGAVTIATNMAGRGTDIQLGGHFEMRLLEEEVTSIQDEGKRQEKTEKIRKEIDEARQRVLEAGGLYVIGTERHESRRIDNQLRGRSGRQGDPGQSKFFVSLEDDLMRIFGSERMDSMLRRLGWKEGEAIIHPWINKALERAQQKVEARHFEVRKQLLKYDDVMNDQRKTVYEQRREIMLSESVHDVALNMRDEIIDELISRCIPEKAYYEQWDVKGLHEETLRLFALDLPINDWVNEEGIADREIKERIAEAAEKKAQEKFDLFGDKTMYALEKHLLLRILDHHWKEHLHSLDHLRQGIGLRAYGQRDPLNEYKREAFELFAQFLSNFRDQYVATLYHIQLREDEEPETVKDSVNKDRGRSNQIIEHRGGSSNDTGEGIPRMNGSAPGVTPIERRRSKVDPNNPPPGWVLHSQLGYHIDPQDEETWGRVPRNAPCPCGSGKKYKQCHGAVN